MCGSMVEIQSATAEIRRGKERKKKKQDKNIMSASATQGGHYYIWNRKHKYNVIFAMLVIVGCIWQKPVYLCHQCITLVAWVNVVSGAIGRHAAKREI